MIHSMLFSVYVSLWVCLPVCGIVCLCVYLCWQAETAASYLCYIYWSHPLCVCVCVCLSPCLNVSQFITFFFECLRSVFRVILSEFSSSVCDNTYACVRVFRCTYYVASVMHVHCVVCSYWQCTLNVEVCSAAITNAWGLKIMWLRHVSHNLVIFLHSIFSHFLGFTYKHIVWAIPWHINLS